MSSLLDLLAQHTSPQDRLAQLQPLIAGGFGLGRPLSSYSSDSSSNWENTARRVATNQYGYTPQEFSMLDSIIERESGWDPNAVNQSSGAYGIPQILPKAHPDANIQGDPMGQIQWLLRYIDQRYGGVQQALAFKDREGWY